MDEPTEDAARLPGWSAAGWGLPARPLAPVEPKAPAYSRDVAVTLGQVLQGRFGEEAEDRQQKAAKEWQELQKREARRMREDAATERQRRIRMLAEQITEREEAVALAKANRAPSIELPPRRTLRDFLAARTEPPLWRVEGLLQEGANGLLVAKAKTGKSTLIANLIRSLVDGDPFLGRFEVRPAPGTTTLLDFELPEDTLRGWLRSQHLRDVDAMEPIPLKGKAGTFDIRRDDVRARWAERLAGTTVLILDALTPVLSALGLAEATEAGDLLPAFDALKAEAGISEMFVVHHMGHTATRARGDSRLEGWPDLIAEYTGEGRAQRVLSARGRDVDLPRTPLHFDRATKRLTAGATETAEKPAPGQKDVEDVEKLPEEKRTVRGLRTEYGWGAPRAEKAHAAYLDGL